MLARLFTVVVVVCVAGILSNAGLLWLYTSQGWATSQGSSLQPLPTAGVWLSGNASKAHALHLTPQNDSYVAFCLSTKDEHHSVREWVLYHHMIGVNKFYIWDDASSPPMYGVLADLIGAGLVDYLYVPSEGMTFEREGTTVQDAKYNTCLYRFGSRHTWMGFIDSDEFVMMNQGSSLPDLLRSLGSVGGVQLYWRMLGTSGHQVRPRAGVLQSYTRCKPLMHASHESWMFKTIARVDACVGTSYVHRCVYKAGLHAVDVYGNQMPKTGLSNIQRQEGERAILYHYVTRSMQDWVDKERKGGGTHVRKKYGDRVHKHDRQSTEVCTLGLEMGESLREKHGDLLNAPAVMSPE